MNTSEPVLALKALAALLGVVVATQRFGLTAAHADAIIAAVTAVLGAVAAWRVRPVAPVVFTTALTALADLFAAFGMHWSVTLVAAVNGLMLAVLAMLTRAQVSPVSGPVVRPAP